MPYLTSLTIINWLLLSPCHQQEPLVSAAKNGHTEIVAMLLKAKGIKVNRGVCTMIPDTWYVLFSLFSFIILRLFLITILSIDASVLCISLFHLQGRYGTPLQAAAANGHTENVAMLLKAKGIDVNKWVSIMTSYYTLISFIIYPYRTPSRPSQPLTPTSIFIISILLFSTGISGSCSKGSYRDRGHVITGQRNWC